MADYVELANSYYRLLRWVEGTEAAKKNTALRALDRMKRFLSDSAVEVVDLTGQPFSEGWAVKVMKIEEGVPENELVFTKMVKPIIQINGELVQEGEVYVGKPQLKEITEQIEESEEHLTEAPVDVQSPENPPEVPDSIPEETLTPDMLTEKWYEKVLAKAKSFHITAQQWVTIATGIVAVILIILVACTIDGQSALRADVAAVDTKLAELTLVDYWNQPGETSIATYEVRNSDHTIIVSQPIGESVTSIIDLQGTPITITTNAVATTSEGE